MLKIITILSLFFTSPLLAQKYPDSMYEEKYSVDYLVKLSKSKQWREILQKADEIALDDRTSEWNRVVSKSIDSLFESFLDRKHNLIDAYMLDFIFGNYEQFLKKRKTSTLIKKVTLKFFYNCSLINYRKRYDQYCGSFFEEHYKRLPNDPGYLFEIGKLVQKYQSPKYALKFYSRSLQLKYSSKACRDKGLIVTSDNALESDLGSLEYRYAHEILFKNCFKDLKTDLLDRTLTRSKNRHANYLRNLCRELKAKKVTFPKQSKCRKH